MEFRRDTAVARLVYILVCECVGLVLALGSGFAAWQGLGAGLLVAGFFILVEYSMRDFSLRGFSTATFGLGIGLLCAWLLTRTGLVQLVEGAFQGSGNASLGTFLGLAINVTLYASLGFIGATLALRSPREDFAFVIPYVRFRQDSAAGHPLLLDAEAILDGRLTRLVEAGFLTGRVIVPRFVLDQFKEWTEAEDDRLKQRGERGLELIREIRENLKVPISLHEGKALEETTVEEKLMEMAQKLPARLVTTNPALNSLASLRGVDLLNLDNLSAALRSSLAVGDTLPLALVKSGKEDHQAVGYLTNGSMIVVNHAAHLIGSEQEIIIVSQLETAGGRLVFAELTSRGVAA